MTPDEMRIRAAEEVAEEFPSSSQAQELVRKIAEFSLRLGIGLKSTTLQERLKYKAMYLRLKEFSSEKGYPYYENVVFIEIDEDQMNHGEETNYGAQ